MKNRLSYQCVFLFIFLSLIFPFHLSAKAFENDILTSFKFSFFSIAKDNTFLLQCIITLLLVMIFGYSAKLFYERKINKK